MKVQNIIKLIVGLFFFVCSHCTNFVFLFSFSSCAFAVQATVSGTRCATWWGLCRIWSRYENPPTNRSARTWLEPVKKGRSSGSSSVACGSLTSATPAPTIPPAAWPVRWRKKRMRKPVLAVYLKAPRAAWKAWTLIRDTLKHRGRMRAWCWGVRGMCAFHRPHASAPTESDPNPHQMHAWSAGRRLRPVTQRTGPRLC